MGSKRYGAQVIIEKEFATKEAAERWMDGLRAVHGNGDVHVETRLWVPAAEVAS